MRGLLKTKWSERRRRELDASMEHTLMKNMTPELLPWSGL